MNRILLLEPGYRNKYPPLGLMKLAAYHKGRGDHVRLHKLRPANASVPLDPDWHRVYVTTLFTFEWAATAQAIDYAIWATGGRPARVFVGGIAASLMTEAFRAESRWAGVRFIGGLLIGPPSKALQLRDSDFGNEDIAGQDIEQTTPDYGILDDIGYRYAVRDAYFGYASRGCVRKCSFCGVPKLEGAQMEMPSLANLVRGVDASHGAKRDLILMDNNVSASARYNEIIAEIRDLGFAAGAKMARGTRAVRRRVDFNQGVDARILAKSDMFLREMSTICIRPLRIAFDHLGLRGVYERSVRTAAGLGIEHLSNYMLYNFHDSASDLYRRLEINIALNQDLGIRIWSFPMRYLPVTDKHRGHVGRKWNRHFLRSFQIMLQATHGVVSGSAEYFHHAFGPDESAFLRLLSWPHAFIFHRHHYSEGEGKHVLDEYEASRTRLTASEESELFSVLSRPGDGRVCSLTDYHVLARDRTLAPAVRRILPFYAMGTHQRLERPSADADQIQLDFELPSEQERVEDAGLYDDDDGPEGSFLCQR